MSISEQFCIRKCINGCLVSKGIHYSNSEGTQEWTEEEIKLCDAYDQENQTHYERYDDLQRNSLK